MIELTTHSLLTGIFHSSPAQERGISLTPRFSPDSSGLKQFEPHRTFSTPLKPGVNESCTRYSAEKCEICGLTIMLSSNFVMSRSLLVTRRSQQPRFAFLQRQPYAKGGAEADLALDFDMAAMRANDALDDH